MMATSSVKPTGAGTGNPTESGPATDGYDEQGSNDDEFNIAEDEQVFSPKSRVSNQQIPPGAAAAPGYAAYPSARVVDPRLNPVAVTAMAPQYPHPSSRPILTVERRNDRLGRALRVTQRELKVVGGQRIQTRLEVFDSLVPGCPVIFSVKHTHGNPWGRQMIVQKNLLLACILAGISNPPLEITKDVSRLFENSDSVQHLHAYMERVLPHIRFPERAPEGIRLYWWRAVENGAAVLHNEATGRLIVIRNKDKRLRSAADTLITAAGVLRRLAAIYGADSTDESRAADGVKFSFVAQDPYYPVELSEDELALLADPDEALPLDRLKEEVQRWAVSDKVSPWMTQLVIKTQQGHRRGQVANIRYSVDCDLQDPEALSIQVHSNEPLSRELQAFPVCLIPMPMKSAKMADVRLCYLRARWFLRKLFEYHLENDGIGGAGATFGATTARPSNSSGGSKFGGSPRSQSTKRACSPIGAHPQSGIYTQKYSGASASFQSQCSALGGGASQRPPNPSLPRSVTPAGRRFAAANPTGTRGDDRYSSVSFGNRSSTPSGRQRASESFGSRKGSMDPTANSNGGGFGFSRAVVRQSGTTVPNNSIGGGVAPTTATTATGFSRPATPLRTGQTSRPTTPVGTRNFAMGTRRASRGSNASSASPKATGYSQRHETPSPLTPTKAGRCASSGSVNQLDKGFGEKVLASRAGNGLVCANDGQTPVSTPRPGLV